MLLRAPTGGVEVRSPKMGFLDCPEEMRVAVCTELSRKTV